MNYAGIDVGSTYTKAAIVSPDGTLLGTGLCKTGFKLDQAAETALAATGVPQSDIDYVASTGYGRHQVAFRDIQITDLTAHSWGALAFFPRTRTVLDVGGQTMKAMRLDDNGRVHSFRLNDKCAAGTGAFLEKTASYLGYEIEEIGALVEESTTPVEISGVCAVFAESEVINHVSNGARPADIVHGAIESLIERSVRLMKRVQMEPEFTLVGGIIRFAKMAEVMRAQLGDDVNVPPEPLVQFTGAIGAAMLARQRQQQRPTEQVGARAG